MTTLTGTIPDLGGRPIVDSNGTSAVRRAWLRTNVPDGSALVDKTGKTVRVPYREVTVRPDGSIEPVTGLLASDAANTNVASGTLQYTLEFDAYGDRIALGPFTITGSTVDLADLVATQALTPTILSQAISDYNTNAQTKTTQFNTNAQGKLDQAAASATAAQISRIAAELARQQAQDYILQDLGTSDGQMKAIDGNPNSQYRIQADARLTATFVAQKTLVMGPATRQYVRVATIDGVGETGGASLVMLVSGQTDYSVADRTTSLVTVAQRGANVISMRVADLSGTGAGMEWFTRQVSTYAFEVWVRRAQFESSTEFAVAETQGNAALLLDSVNASAPTNLVAVGRTSIGAGGGGGSSSLTVQDENANVATGVSQIDFQGTYVAATAGTNEVVVTIGAPSSGIPKADLNSGVQGSLGLADTAVQPAALAAKQNGTARTAVKTAAYSAAVGDMVPVDTSGGAVTVTLPTAPADKSVVDVKLIVASATNLLTVTCGGSDLLNRTGGATSMTFLLLGSGARFQYDSAASVWTVCEFGVPLAQYDARYVQAGASTATPPKVWAGRYTFNAVTGGARNGVFAPTVGTLYAVPYYPNQAQGFDRIAMNVGTAGAAGALIRVMVYAVNSAGRPGNLLVDAGTIDATTTGDKNLTISLTVTGTVLLCFVTNDAAIRIRAIGSSPVTHPNFWAGQAGPVENGERYLTYTGYTTGTPPAVATTAGESVVGGDCPLVSLRAV